MYSYTDYSTKVFHQSLKLEDICPPTFLGKVNKIVQNSSFLSFAAIMLKIMAFVSSFLLFLLF